MLTWTTLALAATLDVPASHATVQDAVDAFARGELDREQLDLVLGALESPEDGATD